MKQDRDYIKKLNIIKFPDRHQFRFEKWFGVLYSRRQKQAIPIIDIRGGHFRSRP
jgi:hypothetical protein